MATVDQSRGVELALPPQRDAASWYLLHGSLMRRGGDYDARLYCELAGGRVWQPPIMVSTSAKGEVDDLLQLPAGIQRLVLVPGDASTEFEIGSLALTPLGPWQARWQMLRHLMVMAWLHPSARLALIGVRFPAAFFDLPGAYMNARKLRAHRAAPSYQDWIGAVDTLSEQDKGAIARHIRSWPSAPSFRVLLLGKPGETAAAVRSRASLDAQLYARFRIVELDHDGAGPDSIQVHKPFDSNEWVLMLRVGDTLAPHALYWFACMVLAHPKGLVVYADEDELDASGRRCRPQFKPDWSWAHARSRPFIGQALVLQGAALAAAGGLGPADYQHGNYDAVLRILDSHGPKSKVTVPHIPAVLLHRSMPPSTPGDNPEADDWAMDAVRKHLARRGVPALVQGSGPGRWRVRHELPAAPPLVSIVVPVRDALHLTRQCMESLLGKTLYPNVEILLVDNQSRDPAALAYYDDLVQRGAVRLLHYDRPFNYSAINNMAVRAAQGQIVCLLNNDTEVIDPDWLGEMVGQLIQPGVGVVGAKLLYPNGRVQHAGTLVGVGGVANHAHAFLHGDDQGYCHRAMVAQEYSAVTAACLLTWRQTYLELGGLNEAQLPVAFNDVDYCLRVRHAGQHVVWTPHAKLYHHESVSRGKDLSKEKLMRAKSEAATMRRRWRHVLGNDPFYNPNLSYARPDFSLSHAPSVRQPWRS